MSRQAYNHGVVLIQCSSCKNRHLIADHLGWFRDSSTTIETLMRERGEKVKRAVVGENDVLEWMPEFEKEENKKEDERVKEVESKMDPSK